MEFKRELVLGILDRSILHTSAWILVACSTDWRTVWWWSFRVYSFICGGYCFWSVSTHLKLKHNPFKKCTLFNLYFKQRKRRTRIDSRDIPKLRFLHIIPYRRLFTVPYCSLHSHNFSVIVPCWFVLFAGVATILNPTRKTWGKWINQTDVYARQ